MNVNITIQRNRSTSNDLNDCNVNIIETLNLLDSQLIDSIENDSTENDVETYESDDSEESTDSQESVESIVMNVEPTTETIRTQVIYDENSIEDINDDKEIINRELKKLKRKNISIIYPNQDATANMIMETFINREVVNIMVIAKTQSGKTGTMCATIQKFMNAIDESMVIPKDNIYIITGLSSCEWIKQTKERLPECIQRNVYHRDGLLKSFINDVKDKKNVLIIMDEIQIASKYQQTIYKTFLEGKFLNGNTLYRNDIKILEFTATPDGTLYDLELWKHGARKILAQPADKYVSSYDIYKRNKMRQYQNLNKKNNFQKDYLQLKEDIESFKTPMYHIIRTPSAKKQVDMVNTFKIYFLDTKYIYEYYDGDSKDEGLDDLNNILKNPPTQHTFIFVKEMLRCAKTLYKKYVGVVYERYSKKPADSLIIQGLAGRLTGYDYNDQSICYTNIKSIKLYEKLWKSNFDNKEALAEWKSGHTKPTFNNIDIYDEEKRKTIVDPKIVKLQFMRVPICIPLEDNENDKKIHDLCEIRGNKKQIKLEKIAFIKNKLLSLGTSYSRLLDFINDSNTENTQITKPSPNSGKSDSYKKHILDTVKAIEENRPFAIDFDKEDKKGTKNLWQAFIGSSSRGHCAIYIIVWSKNPNLY
jgi:hypothetical protein